MLCAIQIDVFSFFMRNNQTLNKKTLKYLSLPTSHIFQPLALVALGPINSTGKLAHRLTGASEDLHETMHLFQQVSVAVQHYISAVLRGIFFRSLPNWTSATPAELATTFVFNPRDLYYCR